MGRWSIKRKRPRSDHPAIWRVCKLAITFALSCALFAGTASASISSKAAFSAAADSVSSQVTLLDSDATSGAATQSKHFTRKALSLERRHASDSSTSPNAAQTTLKGLSLSEHSRTTTSLLPSVAKVAPGQLKKTAATLGVSDQSGGQLASTVAKLPGDLGSGSKTGLPGGLSSQAAGSLGAPGGGLGGPSTVANPVGGHQPLASGTGSADPRIGQSAASKTYTAFATSNAATASAPASSVPAQPYQVASAQHASAFTLSASSQSTSWLAEVSRSSAGEGHNIAPNNSPDPLTQTGVSSTSGSGTGTALLLAVLAGLFALALRKRGRVWLPEQTWQPFAFISLLERPG